MSESYLLLPHHPFVLSKAQVGEPVLDNLRCFFICLFFSKTGHLSRQSDKQSKLSLQWRNRRSTEGLGEL